MENGKLKMPFADFGYFEFSIFHFPLIDLRMPLYVFNAVFVQYGAANYE